MRNAVDAITITQLKCTERGQASRQIALSEAQRSE